MYEHMTVQVLERKPVHQRIAGIELDGIARLLVFLCVTLKQKGKTPNDILRYARQLL